MNIVYYVDSSSGEDTNSGLSVDSAFQSLKRVSDIDFSAGDTILLRCGKTFKGQLKINGHGTSTQPICVGSYGDGALPKIVGTEPVAVETKADFIQIRDLEITNPMGAIGLRILPLNDGKIDGISVCNCYIHDVNVTEDTGHFGYINSGGIIARADGEQPVWFENLLIQDCVIKNVGRMGITVSNSWGWRYSVPGASYIRNKYVNDMVGWYPNRNCRIVGNTIDGTKGDAILIQCGKDILIERNSVYHANSSVRDHAKVAMVAIWTICTVDTVMQYNEVAYTARPGADGEAFDTDHCESNCLIQYNYSHDNAGGFVLLCNGFKGESQGAVIRYNLSVNDGASANGACVQFIGDVKGAAIYNNTFWLSAASRIMDVWRNKAGSTLIANNIFAAPTDNTPKFTARPDSKPGGSVISTVFSNEVESFIFENNIFSNVPLPDDSEHIILKGNRLESLNFSECSTDASFDDKAETIRRFTPHEYLGEASSVNNLPEKDINGNTINKYIFGCADYTTDDFN